MAHYRFHYKEPHQHYLQIEVEIDHNGADELRLFLPAWRPGRYEMGNFAKNVRDFTATDSNGKLLPAMKADAQSWVVKASGTQQLTIRYAFYANIIDAGNSYIGEEMLYVNPVNCCLYKEGALSEPCTLELRVPEHFKTAIALPVNGAGYYTAADFHHLADSPLIASPELKHEQLVYGDARIHFWFQGLGKLEWERLKKDVERFTEAQVAAFGELPCKDYHYLCLIAPGPAHHGVEHGDCTVLYFGPEAQLWEKEKYEEFLALCSHEFYHLWNVKRIRPAEMMPYNYQVPNYSTQGYIYEGITTYYGDLMLLRSGVIDWDDYLTGLSNDLQRHFDNPGRFHYSVAESSFDTWLDGYAAGAPGRKVNIYVEGSMAALILDAQLLKHSNGKHGLDEVMKRLYERFAKKQIGYTVADYKAILAELWTPEQAELYFSRAIEGRGFLEHDIRGAFDLLGLTLVEEPAKHLWMDVFGFKMNRAANGNGHILAVFPGSPADKAGLDFNYEVIKVNGHELAKAEDWDRLFRDEVIDTLSLDLEKQGRTQHLLLQPDKQQAHYYPKINVKRQERPGKERKALLEAWSKQA